MPGQRKKKDPTIFCDTRPHAVVETLRLADRIISREKGNTARRPTAGKRLPKGMVPADKVQKWKNYFNKQAASLRETEEGRRALAAYLQTRNAQTRMAA